MIDFVNIFQNFAYPVAISVILIFAIFHIIKRELKQNDDADKAISQANENFLIYLQKQNERLTNIIADNTKAYNKLINVLDDIQTFLNTKH